MTLGDALDAADALSRVAALPWPVATAYHMSKLLRLLRAEVAIFEEQRVAAVREFGVPRDPTPEERARGSAPQIIQVPPDKMRDYVGKVKALHQVRVTIDGSPLTLDELAGDQRVTGTDLAALGPLLADMFVPAGMG